MRINSALQQFGKGWNSHGIRTAHGMTPNQLFIAGVLQLRQMLLISLMLWITIMEDDAFTNDDNEEGVSFPRSTVQLSEQQLRDLQSRVNP